MDVARRHGLAINHKPIFLGSVFAETGGQPLAQRHPARQRYRMVELQRWREKRGLSFNLKPKFWPLDVSLADRFVIAITAARQDPEPFLRRAFAAIWEEERNAADPLVIAELAEGAGLDSTTLLDAAQGDMTKPSTGSTWRTQSREISSAHRRMCSTEKCSGGRTASSFSKTPSRAGARPIGPDPLGTSKQEITPPPPALPATAPGERGARPASRVC
jgi:2-hydroxychromene-2-carboxylate isomerase